MQAVKGYISNGRFTPTDGAILPDYVRAVLVIAEIAEESHDNFWKEFDRLVDASAHEEMPEFPRLQFGREPIIFTED